MSDSTSEPARIVKTYRDEVDEAIVFDDPTQSRDQRVVRDRAPDLDLVDDSGMIIRIVRSVENFHSEVGPSTVSGSIHLALTTLSNTFSEPDRGLRVEDVVARESSLVLRIRASRRRVRLRHRRVEHSEVFKKRWSKEMELNETIRSSSSTLFVRSWPSWCDHGSYSVYSSKGTGIR